jgi:hypothetical protein
VRIAVPEVERLAPAELVKVGREVVVLVNHDLRVGLDLRMVARRGCARMDGGVVGAPGVDARNAASAMRYAAGWAAIDSVIAGWGKR